MISVELVRLKTTKGIENLLHVDNGRFTSPRIKIFTPTGIKMVFTSFKHLTQSNQQLPFKICFPTIVKWVYTSGLQLQVIPSLPRDIWQGLETFLVVTAWGWVGAAGIQWREAKDAAQHPRRNGQESPGMKNSSPTCELCHRWDSLIYMKSNSIFILFYWLSR